MNAQKLAAALTLAILLLDTSSAGAAPGLVMTETKAAGQRPAFPEQTNAPWPAETSAYRSEILATGLNHPWAIAFLPDGRMLVSERPGALRLIEASGKISAPLTGLPQILSGDTGGLLDVILDPAFKANNGIYFVYLEKRGDLSGIAVARARLDFRRHLPRLRNVSVIFRAEPSAASKENVGSRLLFGKDGMLYVALGDRMRLREQAQDLASHLGKIIRIAPDGKVPSDNPFVGVAGARPEIYALGFRNPEGLAVEPATGLIWELENGAKGGDELNLVKPGANYGWPAISYGRNYDDSPIGTGTARDRMEQPIYYWDPSIAPSGFTFYNSDKFPYWKGNIFLGALKGRRISRLVLENGRIIQEEQMLGELGSRIRTVTQGPDGALYILTDADNAMLVRVIPAIGL